MTLHRGDLNENARSEEGAIDTAYMNDTATLQLIAICETVLVS